MNDSMNLYYFLTGAIVTIGLGFLVNSYYELKHREMDLTLKLMGDDKKALEYVNHDLNKVSALIIFIFAVLLFYAYIAFFSGASVPSPSTTGNITNICENCSYPVTNIINNYSVTINGCHHENMNPNLSKKELQYLMREN